MTEWIPVSERLPKEMTEAVVTFINPDPYYDKPMTAVAIYFNGKWWWWSSECEDYLEAYGESICDAIADDIEIIAWMPLPEPYKGEQDG